MGLKGYKVTETSDIIDKIYKHRDNYNNKGKFLGWESLDEFYSMQLGNCTDWTGFPMSGKTQVLMECLLNTSKFYGWKHLVYFPDVGSNVEIVADLIHKLTGKSFNPLEHSQGSYIRRIKVHRKGCETERSEENYSNETSCIDDCVNTYFIGTRKISRDTYHKSTHGAITSGEYTEIDLLKNNCLPDAACKKPFPFVLTRDGCRKEYYTPEEAIADGLLPRDWMNCKTKYPTNHHWRSILNPYL